MLIFFLQTNGWFASYDRSDSPRGPSHSAQHPAQQAQASEGHVHQPRRLDRHGHWSGRAGREHAQGHGQGNCIAEKARAEQQAEHQRPETPHG